MGTNGQGSGKASASPGESMSDMLRDAAIRERDRSDPRQGLTPDQLRVLRLLALGDDLSSVAVWEQVHPERIRRWLAIPRFQRALRVERRTPTPRAMKRLSDDHDEEDQC